MRLLSLLLLLPFAANAQVTGTETSFTTPDGGTETCVALAPMPGANYSKDDLAREAAFCAIDFNAETTGLCPKTWSTSPGMIVYDLSSGPYARNPAGFERNACAQGKDAKHLAADELAKFKPTINAAGTSGTFSTSSLLYYHFSRYFGTEVVVPVAVWRSMDRAEHLARVARPGVALSGHSHSSEMNSNGWKVLVAADGKPESYHPTDDLFTPDRKAIHGIMLKTPGERYNSEMNSSRVSGRRR